MQDGEDFKVKVAQRATTFKVTPDDVEHIQCLLEALPTELNEGQRAKTIEFCRRIREHFLG